MGAAILAKAVVLSVIIYMVPTVSEEQRIDPIALMGALLLIAGLIFTVAKYLLLVRGFGGDSMPIGVIFLYAFGGILFGMERVDDES